MAIRKGYDYVICGHIHQAQNRVVENNEGKTTYLNSGDWVENLTSLEFNNNEWDIYRYNELAFSQIDVVFKQKNSKLPKVDSETIDFYINTLMI